MNGDDAQARAYRTHAAELRETAKSTRDKTSREIFMGLADKYEQMARMLDEIAATDRKLRDRKST
jgi:hypothetical protein